MHPILRNILITLAIGVAAVFFFKELDVLTYRIWDESRVATNSYEMANDFRFPATTFQTEIDTWNTKPPLLPLMQSTAIRAIGMSEWAVRLPSAIAGFVLCIGLIWFGFKTSGSIVPGIIATFLIISSEGSIGMHGFRYGDYDGPLVLWLMLTVGGFYFWTEQRVSVWIPMLFITLAFYTKGIAAFIILPALLIYLLLFRKGKLLIQRGLWFGLMGFLVVLIVYLVTRELQRPGFLEAMWANDIGGRFGASIEGHRHPFEFYVKNFKVRMEYFWIAGSVSIVLAPLLSTLKNRKLAILISLASVWYFMIISVAQTKLDWYDLPLYPLMGFQIGMVFVALFDRIKNKTLTSALSFIVIAIGAMPVWEKYDDMFPVHEYPWHERYYAPSYYLREHIESGDTLGKLMFVDDEYAAHNWLYISQLNEMTGNDISYTATPDTLKVGQSLTAHHKRNITRIDSIFHVDRVDSFESVIRMKIISRKAY